MVRVSRIFVSAMVVIASGTVVAQTREVAKAGPWSIKAVNGAQGSPEYCKAEMPAPSGPLRFDQAAGPRPAKKLAIPSLGLPDGSKVPAVIATPVRTVKVPVEIKGNLGWIPLSEQWLAEARRGGTLTITIGHDRLTWDLRDFDRAVAATERCVGGSIAPPPPPRGTSEVTAFMHSKGSFRRNGAKWSEYDDQGKRSFDFVEVSMDAQFVVLKDERRNMFIRLPLAGGPSFFAFNTPKGPWKQMYTVTPRR